MPVFGRRRLSSVAVHCICVAGAFPLRLFLNDHNTITKPGALSFSFFSLCLLLALNVPFEAGSSDHLHSLYTTEEFHQSILSLTVSTTQACAEKNYYISELCAYQLLLYFDRY